jgi:acetyl esterase/lipase
MRFILAVMIVFSVAACQKTASNDATPGGVLPASVQLNTGYGADAKQKMDIYLPAGRKADSTKLMFLVHGGGWNEGDKADFTAYITTLQQRFPGWAFVNINYRLAANGQNVFPAQENDVKSAVEFVYSKRSDYQVSDQWVFLGASAGAHLAQLQAYKYSSPIKAKAVVSFFGPSDLTVLYNTSPLLALGLFNVTGTTPVLNATLYQQSSPVNFISAQAAPTILLHGGADPLVPPSQSTIVRDKLQSFGVANQYVFYPARGHGWDGAELVDSFDKITAFIQAQVH